MHIFHLASVVVAATTSPAQPNDLVRQIGDVATPLVTAIIGLVGVFVGARVAGKYQLLAIKETRKWEKIKLGLEEVYVPLASAISDFIDEFFDTTNKDLSCFDYNRLLFYNGTEWDALKNRAKEANSPSKRQHLRLDHRKQIEKLNDDIILFREIRDECVRVYFEKSDELASTFGETPDPDAEMVAEAILTEPTPLNSGNLTVNNTLGGILTRYHNELSKHDTDFMQFLVVLKKELTEYIDSIGDYE